MPYAEVAEQADAHDSKSCSERSVGSIPTFGTSLGRSDYMSRPTLGQAEGVTQQLRTPFSLVMHGWLRVVVWLGLGLLLGAGLGLYLGWGLMPTEYTEADPALLEAEYRRDYTVMIAAAYAQDGNLAVAQQRLAALHEPDANAWLLSLTVDTILNNGNEQDIRHLARLAHDLGVDSPALAPYLPTPESNVSQ